MKIITVFMSALVKMVVVDILSS